MTETTPQNTTDSPAEAFARRAVVTIVSGLLAVLVALILIAAANGVTLDYSGLVATIPLAFGFIEHSRGNGGAPIAGRRVQLLALALVLAALAAGIPLYLSGPAWVGLLVAIVCTAAASAMVTWRELLEARFRWLMPEPTSSRVVLVIVLYTVVAFLIVAAVLVAFQLHR